MTTTDRRELVARLKLAQQEQEQERAERRRAVVKAQAERRQQAREQHIEHATEFMEREARRVSSVITGACVFCGERRNIDTGRAGAGIPDRPVRNRWSWIGGVTGPACSACWRAWQMNDDLQEMITWRLHESRPDVMKNFRRKPTLSQLSEGASPDYDLIGRPRRWVWALHVIGERRAGRRDPSPPKSPFRWK